MTGSSKPKLTVPSAIFIAECFKKKSESIKAAFGGCWPSSWRNWTHKTEKRNKNPIISIFYLLICNVRGNLTSHSLHRAAGTQGLMRTERTICSPAAVWTKDDVFINRSLKEGRKKRGKKKKEKKDRHEIREIQDEGLAYKMSACLVSIPDIRLDVRHMLINWLLDTTCTTTQGRALARTKTKRRLSQVLRNHFFDVQLIKSLMQLSQ